MLSPIDRVKAAIAAFQAGKMVILMDNPERENEGDLIIPAEKITPNLMNFMIREGTGIVCMAMQNERLAKLQLPLMVPPQMNTCARGTQFTVSVDAKKNVTTGVSAHDRTETVLTLINENAQKDDLITPGHVFPLQAKSGGVFERQGHTEGAVDLALLAGFQGSAVICEVMNEDGSMARGIQLMDFAKKHGLLTLSIEDIITYRLSVEDRIESESSASLPLEKYGSFKMMVFKEMMSQVEQVVLIKEGKSSHSAPLVRVHSTCMTGDLFSSKRCDCHQQLHYSLEQISREGGILIYLNQEGRGIGLFNKIKAYSLQEKGLDTVEANHALGLPTDARKYYMAANILRRLNIKQIRLLTNNPGKISDLSQYGLQIEQILMPSFTSEHNRFYLKTKKDKLNHAINIDFNAYGNCQHEK